MLKHFIIKEFVPPETWEAEGENSITHVDERLLITAEQLWEYFNSEYKGNPNISMVINDWCYDGKYRYRGYRSESCTIGARHSMHREIDDHLCCAIDFDIYVYKNYKKILLPADVVRLEITNNRKKFPYIMRMEDDVSWVHVDIKGAGAMGSPTTPLPPIHLFKP